MPLRNMLKHPSCIERPKIKDPALYCSFITSSGFKKLEMEILYKQRCILRFFREVGGLSWYPTGSMHDFSIISCS